MTPPLNRRCVGQASPLGPRRTGAAAARRGRLPGEEPRQVARHGRIRRVGQPELLQTHAARASRHLVAPTAGKKPSSEHRVHIVARQRSVIVPPISREPLPSRVTGLFARDASRAASPSRRGTGARGVQLPRVDAMAVRLEPLLQQAREREVHVVAAEQDVIADRDALEREVAVVLADRDQAEVGRAAADVADEDRSPTRIRRRQLVALRVEPRVEGGLRLLEQRDVSEAGAVARRGASARAPLRRTMPAR